MKPRQSCQALARGAFGFFLVLYAAAVFVYQHQHITSQHADHAALLSSAKEAFLGQPRVGLGSRPRCDPTRSRGVACYRPAPLILQNPNLPDWVKQVRGWSSISVFLSLIFRRLRFSSCSLTCKMVQYAAWHKQQRQRYIEARRNNSTDADDVKFLIMRCLTKDHCGGASDRLQDVPWNIMWADQTNRVLLLRWEKPAPLETFLVPPEGGIDWTLRGELYDMLRPELDENNWNNLMGRTERQFNEGVESSMRVVSWTRVDRARMFRTYENEKLGGKKM